MRRLLQFGTFLFILTALLAPLAECFDRWDAPGLTDDTEFTLFALVFVLCLVLLISKLISVFAQLIHLVALPLDKRSERLTPSRSEAFFGIIPSLSSPPLRI